MTNKKKRELLKQKHLKEKRVESVDQLLDLMAKPLDRRTSKTIDIGDDWKQRILELILKGGVYTELDSFIELCLADYETATAQQQRGFTKSLVDLACTEKWAWEALIELVRREPIIPILKDTFVLPALEGKLKPPEESHGYGRTPNNAKNVKDPGRDIRIVSWITMLRKNGFTVEEACEVIAKRKEIALSTERTKKIYYGFKNQSPSKKSKNAHPLKNRVANRLIYQP